VGKLGQQLFFSLTTLVFHIAILVVPLFLAGHIALWYRGLGLNWPAIPNHVADLLTIVAVVTALALVVQRLMAKATRALSRFQDYALPLLIALPFASGYLLMHPWLNPFGFDATMLVHVMSANLIFILIPLTKLSHVALLPSVQLVSEAAWHWPADSGSKVGLALNKEGEPV
jgi:nitrate reductase gamma subunit